MSSAQGEIEIAILPFGKHHIREEFSCGIEPLDRYLKKLAGKDARNRIAAPFVLAGADNRVIGYYTLSSFSIILGDLPDKLARKLPKYPRIPATLIGRLAVDRNYHGRGLGEYLLMDALHRSWEHSKQIASYAVVVDAKDERATAFYQAYEFKLFPNQPSRLSMPMKKIERLLKTS